MNNIKNGGGIPFYYWFLSGLALGLLMGWFFHGTISMILRLALLIGVIAVVVLGVYLWQKASSNRSNNIASDIPEGNWRDIDPSGRS
jgi:predicted lipid-binding transport protein (Tim44 family)